ncbi:MAG: hypothetical protein ACR2RV_20290, partial [Verrucomicrobiales bacterium]
YNNVYAGTDLRGGGTGEESLDLFLVTHDRHPFPLHPDRKGDERDYMRRGSIKNLPGLSRAETNEAGDSFGQFAFDDYYGPGSRWIRRAVLTREGYLLIADEYIGGAPLREDYRAGPVWHLALGDEIRESGNGPHSIETQTQNWFDAPAFAHAWWQNEKIRVLLYIHQDSATEFGRIRQRYSQDTDPNITCFASRQIQHGQSERFLSALVPYPEGEPAQSLSESIDTQISEIGTSRARIKKTTITLMADGTWAVVREEG